MTQFGKILAAAALAVLVASLAAAAEPAVSAGPGTIACKGAAHCIVGIGSPASIKYTVDATALPDADKARLKTCAAGKPPCIATVTGTEMGDPLKVKASAIKWYN